MQTIRSELVALARSYRDDHDGGYRLATALCEFRAGLLEGNAEQWDDVLLGWVREETPEWGVALEALARVGGESVSGALSGLLDEPQRSVEFREYLVHALIRRGAADDTVLAIVEENAKLMRPLGLPNLAALLGVRPDMLTKAVECIVAALSDGREHYVEANVPPFFYAAADSDPMLLVRLVAEVFGQSQPSGLKFFAMVERYLAKPFVQKRLGAEAMSTVLAALRRIRGS